MSHFVACLRPHRLAWPRTPAFQAGNTGSNPVGDTKLHPPIRTSPFEPGKFNPHFCSRKVAQAALVLPRGAGPLLFGRTSVSTPPAIAGGAKQGIMGREERSCPRISAIVQSLNEYSKADAHKHKNGRLGNRLCISRVCIHWCRGCLQSCDF